MTLYKCDGCGKVAESTAGDNMDSTADNWYNRKGVHACSSECALKLLTEKGIVVFDVEDVFDWVEHVAQADVFKDLGVKYLESFLKKGDGNELLEERTTGTDA